MIVSFYEVLLLAMILFLLGLVCAAAQRNLIMILVGVEIMLNATGVVFVGASLNWRSLDGQVFFLFILALAAAEVSVGLALIVYSQRQKGTVHADRFDTLKG